MGEESETATIHCSWQDILTLNMAAAVGVAGEEGVLGRMVTMVTMVTAVTIKEARRDIIRWGQPQRTARPWWMRSARRVEGERGEHHPHRGNEEEAGTGEGNRAGGAGAGEGGFIQPSYVTRATSSY